MTADFPPSEPVPEVVGIQINGGMLLTNKSYFPFLFNVSKKVFESKIGSIKSI